MRAISINKEEFKETWDDLLMILQSMETEKQSLKDLKAKLGTIVGSESSKETNAIIKALLKKYNDNEYYDNEIIDAAEDIWSCIFEKGEN